MLEKLPAARNSEARRLDARTVGQLKSIADPYRNRQGRTGLFSGEDRESKMLAARLLGEWLGCDVYRIDLSSLVSKYVGETEKNLERILAGEDTRDTVLLLDEADALFGRRSEAGDAGDRYANQETNHSLQRVEDFDGLVILSANLRGSLDDALLRRCAWEVEFPPPGSSRRASLWERIRRRLASAK